MLHLIGLGLGDESDLTIREIHALQACDIVYLEDYTNIVHIDEKHFFELTGKKITRVGREFVEDSQKIVQEAGHKNIAILISGDPLSATTHFELYAEAKSQGVHISVHHNASVFSAISATGLSLYKFGATVSVPNPEPNFRPESFYDHFEKNHAAGMHTLFLIDPNEKKGKKLSLQESLEWLKEIDHKRANIIKDTSLIVACSSLGTHRQKIIAGGIGSFSGHAFEHPVCFIVPGPLNFKEEEALALYKV